MQGLGGTGAQQSKDCSFAAGTVAGAPLRISWFLVIFFVYQLIDAMNSPYLPAWVRIARATGNEFLLLLTVLCHEMGHGTMARRCGGEIAEVLLWPFGGICFTTRARGRDSHQKLVDDLWIVGAGPATHFPMAGAWLVLMVAFASACSHVVLSPSWRNLLPFAQQMAPCVNSEAPGCFHSYAGWLSYMFLEQAIQINVMLFMFNVFFPMYPMDGAKLIVCSLQLFCRASARCAAKVLVYTSVPLAVLFIVHSFMGLSGGGLQPGITAYMGLMCLMESYKIYQLMKEERLHTHPLFELARSSTRSVTDSMGTTQRLNTADQDDEETPGSRLPQVQFRELRPFSGAGRSLAGGAANQSSETSHTPSAASVGAKVHMEAQPAPAQSPAARNSWLDRLERSTAENAKTVRQLEDERLERERLERVRFTQQPDGGI